MNELEDHLNQEEQTWMGVENILRPETAVGYFLNVFFEISNSER